jgi:hypothetical protein
MTEHAVVIAGGGPAGDPKQVGLAAALTTWFGPSAAACAHARLNDDI